MTAVDALTLGLGICVALVVGLVTGILTWWNGQTLPASVLAGGGASGAALGLWFAARSVY